MKAPRLGVSVVIPVRDGAPYLAEALESVAAQTLAPDEVIVVDDGSRDGSAAIAEAGGARCLRQGRLGIAAARNAGVRAAGCETIAFLDADDLWSEDKLVLQVGRLADDPSLDGVTGLVEQFVSPEVAAADRAAPRVQGGHRGGGVAGTLLVRSASFAQTGGFDERWVVGEFLDWWLRAEELGLRVATIPTVVLRRRVHGANTMRANRRLEADYPALLKASLDRRRKAAG